MVAVQNLYLLNIPIQQLAIEGANNMEVKYLTKEQFQRLNNRAIKRNANRTVKRKFIELLTDGLKFPIIETFLHNDVEMRCRIALNSEGNTCWLDISLSDFDVLPTIDTA